MSGQHRKHRCVYMQVSRFWGGEIIYFSEMRDLLVNGTTIDSKAEDDSKVAEEGFMKEFQPPDGGSPEK